MSCLNCLTVELEKVRHRSFVLPFIFLCTIYKCQDLLWKNNHRTPPNPRSYFSSSLSSVIQLSDRANLFQFIGMVQGTLPTIHQLVSPCEIDVGVIDYKYMETKNKNEEGEKKITKKKNRVLVRDRMTRL